MDKLAITSDARSDERLRLFVESLSEYAIALLDRAGQVVGWSTGAQRLHGWSAREVLGQHFSCLFTEEDIRNRKPETNLRTAASEGSVEESGWRLRKDGRRYWATVTLRALREENGTLFGFAQTTAEHTELAALGRLLEAAPDPMVVVNPDGEISLANTRAETLFGYAHTELVGKPLEVLVPERLRAQHAQQRRTYLTDPKTRPMDAGLDLNARRKDGTEFPVDISLNPIETAQGILVTSAIRDVTARRHAEMALKKLNEELEAFNYSVGHDLRAPLRGMAGFAQILLDDYGAKLDETGRDCLQEICAASRKMGELLDGLLALTRVASTELKLETVNLSTVASQTMARLSNTEPLRRVAVTIALDLTARVDTGLIRLLFEHLLGNAWKFTRNADAASIHFGVTEREGSATYFVRDNGAGFDMAFARKLFIPFQRLHAVGEFPGVGTGLATVQRIVHRHGGRVWAEGAVDRGATIYFTLPSANSNGGSTG